MQLQASVLLSLLAALAAASPVPKWQPPVPVEEAAREARTLLLRESLGNLATIHQDGELAGTPVSFVEYYADCDNAGSPYLLALNVGTSFRNIAAGSPASLNIRVGDHPMRERVDPHYPGAIIGSPAGSPRISLKGKLVDVEDPAEIMKAETCFLKRHPEAHAWLPGNPVHTSRWTKFEVENVYLLGGFGDRAYIGEIPLDLYKSSEPIGKYEVAEDGAAVLVDQTADSNPWKDFGKEQKKHWKNVGKQWKKKFAPPEDSDDEAESADEQEEAAPSNPWKDYGKEQKKYWKKYGKQWKKKFAPPADSDDEMEEQDVSDIPAGPGPDEDPADYWKKYGKNQKKQWKNYGKEWKKKFAPPADSDDEMEEQDVSDIPAGPGPDEDPADYWKKYGKNQKKQWKNYGKEWKKKFAPPADSDDEVEEQNVSDIPAGPAPGEDPSDYWKNHGKNQKKQWKKHGKEWKKKFAPPADSDDEVEEQDVSDIPAGPAPGEDPSDYWKNHGKNQKKQWKKHGKEWKKKFAPPADSDDEADAEDIEDIPAGPGPDEDPADYWKKYGHEMHKKWKNFGKDQKQKWTPPAAEAEAEAESLLEHAMEKIHDVAAQLF